MYCLVHIFPACSLSPSRSRSVRSPHQSCVVICTGEPSAPAPASTRTRRPMGAFCHGCYKWVRGYAPVAGIPLGWSEICLNVLNTNNMYTILVSTVSRCCHRVCVITIVVVVRTLWQWPSALCRRASCVVHRCRVMALATHVLLSSSLHGGSGHVVIVIALAAWWWPRRRHRRCVMVASHACPVVVVVSLWHWPCTSRRCRCRCVVVTMLWLLLSLSLCGGGNDVDDMSSWHWPRTSRHRCRCRRCVVVVEIPTQSLPFFRTCVSFLICASSILM